MNTINISLPIQLKTQADTLVAEGFFASFSDLVRHSLRQVMAEQRYDKWAREAKRDEKAGKAHVINTVDNVDDFMSEIAK
jgi:Arc/MetJ-type ribon-helix-helix transcriptional regulator